MPLLMIYLLWYKLHFYHKKCREISGLTKLPLTKLLRCMKSILENIQQMCSMVRTVTKLRVVGMIMRVTHHLHAHVVYLVHVNSSSYHEDIRAP